MKILLQTTIPFAKDDWHAGRFSLLTDELRNDGYDLTARNREPAGGPIGHARDVDGGAPSFGWLKPVSE